MKKLADIAFDLAQGARELREFRELLASRADKVKVDSIHVGCMTYDDLYDALAFRMRIWGVATDAEES